MSPRVYLDHAATSPMVEVAREAWLAASASVGNPSSLHHSGRHARRLVEESRESIAGCLNVRPSAVVFTSGGTESDNLALKGLYWARVPGADRVLASAVEHHAVLDPIGWLEAHEGARIGWLPVDPRGRVPREAVVDALAGGPAAVCSVMWANNEIGTIQPVREIAELCAAAGVPFHTDAVQALGWLPLDLSDLPAAVTLSSHKVGGPFGVGALVVDPRTALVPLLHGGGQEREVRSGTLDAPAIAGFAAAVRHAVDGQVERSRAAAALRERIVTGISASLPEAIVNGDPDPEGRLPGTVHVSFPGCEGDLMLMLLDAAGIDCSTGSACTAGIPEPSHVLLALGADPTLARSSLRFSVGETTTPEQVDVLLAALPAATDRARRAGRLAARPG
jgi:cysteine desulfurase